MASVDFQEWINELRELPSGASQWEFVSRFIEEVGQIAAEKEIERNRFAEVVGAIGDVIDEFSEVLEFLKLQEGLSSLKTASSQCDVKNVLAVIKSFKASLVDYLAAKEALNNPRDHEFLIRNVAKLEQAAEMSRAHYNALRDLLEDRLHPDGQQSDSAADDEPSNTFIESVPDEVETRESDSSSDPEDITAEQIEDGEQDAVGEVVAHDGLRLDEGIDLAPYEGEHPGTSNPQNLKMEDSKPAIDGQDIDKAPLVPEDALEGAVGLDDVSGEDSEDNPTSETSTVTLAARTENTESAEPSASTELTADGIVGSASTPDERRYGIEESRAAAHRYLKTSSLHDLETLMWSLVAEDDLSAAYWVARHLYDQNHKDVIPPSLLRAIQGSRWLIPDSNRYVGELFEFTREYDGANASSSCELLELAATLRSSLIAPHSNMWGLLKTPEACQSAGSIVSTFGEFARYGHSLRQEYIEGMGESVRYQDEMVAASEEAKSWLESAPARRYSTFQPATNLWIHLTGDGGPISKMLAPVRDDDRMHVQSVRDLLEEDSEDLINRIDRSLADGPWTSITGRARNWLFNGITEAKSLAERWCELVENEREARVGSQDIHLIEMVTNLRSEVQRHSNQLIEALSELTADSEPMDVASAAQCVLRSMCEVMQSLDIRIDVEIPQVSPVVGELSAINQSLGSHSLSSAVARRLLWTDSVDFGDDGSWEGQSLDGVIHSLAQGVAETMTLEKAIQQRFVIQDFRFFELMMEAPLPAEQKESLRNRCEMAQQDSLVTLKRHVEDVKELVIQAVRDGVIEIDDDNWILYELEIADVVEAVDAEEKILNYASMSIQLQDVQEGIERQELERQNELREEWDETFSKLAENDAPSVQAWREKFQAARDNRNIRVMEECVIRLNDHSLGEPLPDSDPIDADHDFLTEFVYFVDDKLDIEEYVRDSSGLVSLQSSLGLS